jgi:uncharacterized protein
MRGAGARSSRRSCAPWGSRPRSAIVEWAQWLEQVFTGKDFGLTIVSHTEPMDIGIYANGPTTTSSMTMPDFQKIMDELTAETDPMPAKRPLKQAQEKIANDYVNGYLFQLARAGVANARVKGLWPNAPDLAQISCGGPGVQNPRSFRRKPGAKAPRMTLQAVTRDGIAAEITRPDPARVRRGDPVHTTWNIEDRGTLYAGLWQSTPGAWEVDYAEWEYIRILEGHSVLIDTSGAETHLRAGDSWIIRPGFKGVWDVRETTLKDYVILA